MSGEYPLEDFGTAAPDKIQAALETGQIVYFSR